MGDETLDVVEQNNVWRVVVEYMNRRVRVHKFQSKDDAIRKFDEIWFGRILFDPEMKEDRAFGTPLTLKYIRKRINDSSAVGRNRVQTFKPWSRARAQSC